ncbi:MAG: 3-dehydroquinate synthase [Phycisphaerae bacterium]
MTDRIEPIELCDCTYAVTIGHGLLARIGGLLADRLTARRAFVIADESVAALHGPALLDGLRRAGFDTRAAAVPAGEGGKTLEVAARLYLDLAREPVDRRMPIIALGGGATGDVAGFVAATWLRGVPLVLCPTTVEAAVDAAIGGKSAVNIAAAKNLVGAIHQPIAVMTDVGAFATLSERDLHAGLAECVKHALIRASDRLTWLTEQAGALLARDAATLVELVGWNVRIKAAVVAADPRETGGADGIGRAALNFGHTVGHALESHSGYALRHGECVALGLLAALRLGVERGVTPAGWIDRTRDVLARLGLPARLPAAVDTAALWDHAQRDKKRSADGVRFVVVGEAGLAWAERVTPAEFERAVAEIAPADRR